VIIDIVLSIDGACTLADVVIVDSIHAIENSIHPIHPIHPIVLKITPSKKSWHNSCDPSKGWDLLWLTLKGSVLTSWWGDIWSLALASGQFSTLMS
jgi:hypothetical protein